MFVFVRLLSALASVLAIPSAYVSRVVMKDGNTEGRGMVR